MTTEMGTNRLSYAGPVAMGLVGSVIQFDQEPTYSAAGMPARVSARTSWAAVTPEPQ